MNILFGLMVCSVLLGFTSANAVASDYSDGLAAYLEQDYKEAHTQWLKGAKARDARSMFNLGLLHEQGLVEGANQSKAESWFRLASKNGYAPADYHLALYLQANGASESIVEDLLKRASDNGYQPAKKRLQGPNRSNRAKSSASSTTKAQEINSSYRTENWLARKPPNSWTIQMLAFNDERKVQAFIDDHGLKQQAAYYAEKANGETLYKLVYGIYQSKDKADFARQNLSGDLKKHGPWLRSVASVQQAIKDQ